jgi:hypothetical protein
MMSPPKKEKAQDHGGDLGLWVKNRWPQGRLADLIRVNGPPFDAGKRNNEQAPAALALEFQPGFDDPRH